MYRFLTFALAVVLCPFFEARAEQSDTAQLLEEAWASRIREDFAQAAALAAKAASGLTNREQGYARLLQGLSEFDEQHWSEAEKALAAAAPLLPHLADRIALIRGDALFRLGRYEESLEEYSEARKKAAIDVVAMRADLGRVKAMLGAEDRFAIQRAAQLLIRYPTLPERDEINHEIARALEKQGRKSVAYIRYRKLWKENPQGLAGKKSGERIQVLVNGGLRVARVQHSEHLDRARILVSDREYDAAEREILTALHSARGSIQHHLQLELAVVAFRRNEFDRARNLLLDLAQRRGPTGPWLERIDIATGNPKSAIQRVLKGTALGPRTPPGKRIRVAEYYLDAGEYEKARHVLNPVRMARSPGFFGKWLPWIAFKAGQYDKAIPGFRFLQEDNWSQGRRQYWIGRAQHKAGHPCEARAAYEEAIRQAPHGYYGIWARQRMAQLRDEIASQPRDGRSKTERTPLRCPAPTEEDADATVAWTEPDPLMLWKIDPRRLKRPTREEGLDAFEKLMKSHGKNLPWLLRARDLWLSGDSVGAGEELNQTLWVSRGFLVPRVGLPRLWGGQPQIKRISRRGSSRFGETELELFVTATKAVGETGLALHADRPDWGDLEGWHPKAFEPTLRAAARRHGVQPELMWSIMRIESYFNRHAISYAHALGLMQILPRTGRRVARRMEVEDFQVADLLDPRRGLDFSGWYLGELSKRFHGQYPLMIAAYNGGPHNVALWIMRRTRTDDPLAMDEFCEEIPFSETYRYVRRVSGSLAVYHALEGLPPPQFPFFVNRDVAKGVNF